MLVRSPLSRDNGVAKSAALTENAKVRNHDIAINAGIGFAFSFFRVFVIQFRPSIPPMKSTDLAEQLLAHLNRKNYQPLKPKALARKLGVPASQYAAFKESLHGLIEQGRVELGKSKTVRV